MLFATLSTLGASARRARSQGRGAGRRFPRPPRTILFSWDELYVIQWDQGPVLHFEYGPIALPEHGVERNNKASSADGAARGMPSQRGRIRSQSARLDPYTPLLASTMRVQSFAPRNSTVSPSFIWKRESTTAGASPGSNPGAAAVSAAADAPSGAVSAAAMTDGRKVGQKPQFGRAA